VKEGRPSRSPERWENEKKRGGKIKRGEVKGSLMRRDMPRQEGRERIVLGEVGERERRERERGN
jgi:hypothetical protein